MITVPVVSFIGMWRETSVRGGVYSLRETRSVPSKSQRVDSESNVLVDGTLIDLCGATLVWRSQSGELEVASRWLVLSCS